MTDETEGWPSMAGIGHNSGEVAVETPATYEIKYKGQPATEEPEHFRLRRNHELQTWLNAKPVLAEATKNERELRDRITATCFPNPTKGTQRYDMGGGYKLKLVHGFGYTLGNKEAVDADDKKISIAAQIGALEEAIANELGEDGTRVFERLVSWKPELSGSEWEKLAQDANASAVEIEVVKRIGEVLTVKPAAPQLTFEEPKAT
jgi:hypothetical protein